MSSIANLDDTRGGRCPFWLRISPEEFEVDDCVWWSSINEFHKDRCPLDLLHAGHFFHALEHFLFVDGVAPALLLSSGDIVVHDPYHDVLSAQSQGVS